MAAEEDYLGLTREEREALTLAARPDVVDSKIPDSVDESLWLAGRQWQDSRGIWWATDLGRLALRVDAMIDQGEWA